MPPQLPRIRQVVLAARDLDPVANRLRDALHVSEPFSDPGVREVFAVTHEDIAEVHHEPGLTVIRIGAPHDRFELTGVRFQPVASQVKARRCESC